MVGGKFGAFPRIGMELKIVLMGTSRPLSRFSRVVYSFNKEVEIVQHTTVQ